MIERLARMRARYPDAIGGAAVARNAVEITTSSSMLIIAADHPARGSLGSGTNPLAMADRGELLFRLAAALRRPDVHGVLATADILEDLLLLGVLNNKLVFGSMNRGGLAGSAFELDDRFTGYTAAAIERMNFTGGKMLLRIDPADAGTVRTMESAAHAIDELAERKRIALIEPFWSGRKDGVVTNDLSPDAVIRSMAVASGLGSTSAYSWLKLPVVAEMERVLGASTLPVLLLGGEAQQDRDAMFERWQKALSYPTVRGLVVGRNLLYPPDDDVDGAIDAAVRVL